MVNKVLYRISCLQIVIHLILSNWVIATLFLELNVFITITIIYMYINNISMHIYEYIYEYISLKIL